MLKKLLSGVSAGILISIGGAVFLACENRYVGAVFFSVALLCICMKGYSLFTGKIGFIPEKHDGEAWSVLLWGLLGNFIATMLCGLAIRYAVPASGDVAETICAAKLTQAIPQTFLRACFCGVLMYLAVSIYRDQKTPLAILFCIPVFILSGFEHSIADMFYFAASGAPSGTAALFLVNVLLGNSVGGMLLPCLAMLGGKNRQ